MMDTIGSDAEMGIPKPLSNDPCFGARHRYSCGLALGAKARDCFEHHLDVCAATTGSAATNRLCADTLISQAQPMRKVTLTVVHTDDRNPAWSAKVRRAISVLT